MCLKWIDRTHKVTNPIKLIIQVLNYTRKHRYPERRSAFTYIDEEQPSRIDFGKEKFGGPFTEEEVEDEELQLAIALSLGEDDSQSEDRQEDKVIQSVAEHEPQELEDEHLLQLAIGLSLGEDEQR